MIDPITDEEALDWINSVTDGKVENSWTYHIYYLENNGNITNAKRHIGDNEAGKHSTKTIVYSPENRRQYGTAFSRCKTF